LQKRFGFALSLAQNGDRDNSAKILKGYGGAGVLDLVEESLGNAYRAVYTVKFAEAVFVLHCFQKEKQTRHRHAERRYGNYSCQAKNR